ncbi:MAG: putative acetyltransferase [Sulfitobacter sp.]|jgi:predicted acetyltransferase
MSGKITLSRVAEPDRAVLENMAKRHFSEIFPDGPLFYSAALDRYWIETGRHPYLIQLDGRPIGFALVWNHADGCHELAEFTIEPAFRKQGIGTEAATMIFGALGGDWVLGVAKHAPDGMAFWQKCLEGCDDIHEITLGPPRAAQQCGSYSFRVGR